MVVRPRARGTLGRPAVPIVFRAAFALIVVTLAGCSPSAETTGTPVNVTLRDFRIHASASFISDSDVVFQVHNAAPATHEFVVVPTDLPSDALPLASDGLSVEEEAFEIAGEISEVPAGTTAALELHLPPGRYVFFCNLEGHYLGGMHGALQITETAAEATA
jgi:uncharacterized cupredoxin-like copper-binding protein